MSRSRQALGGVLERHGRGAILVLCAIVALGFGLRANRALHPVKDVGVDSKAYSAIAKALYEDHRYGTETMRNATDWSPGAPLLHAGVYYATGGTRDRVARLFVALLGSGAIAVAYLLARRLAGPGAATAAGLLAALGVAVYPPFIHNTGRLMSEPPVVLTLPAAVLAFLWAADNRGRGPWVWAPAGLLFGVTSLFRPEFLTVGIAFALFALVFVWRDRGGRAGVRPGLFATGVLLLAFMLPILPWTIRNAIALDRLVPISTGGGKALFVGTYVPGDGDYFRTKQRLAEQYLHRPVPRAQLGRVSPVPLFDRVAARYPGLPRDAALARAGRDNLERYLRDDPLGYAGMVFRKVWRMWRTGSVSMQGPVGFVWQRGLELLALIAFGLLAVRRRWEGLVFALVLAAISATAALTLATPRRNETVMALVIVLAACGAVWSAEAIRARRAERASS
jgi:4-amino-4-deoxy-L-arabinose transferase-like glycosyltransferase